jgi:DNA-binding Lrp family transcriptional regulator
VKRILEILEQDARCSTEEIATRLDMTPEAVAEAIQGLEQDGTILGYRALVDWQKASDDKLYAFIEVKATPEPRTGFDEVADHISRFPQVHSLYLMSGQYDLIVVVEGKDLRGIANFVAEELAPHPQVVSTSTHFVLRTYKRDGVLVPAEKADDKRLVVSP